MDRLVVMKSFVTVARASSFSGAARELGISSSLISRHVADLERQLGVRLLNRTARSMSLTEAGQRYCEFSRRILDEIDAEDGELALERDVTEGTLAIVCPKWVGTLDLGDAVAAFAIAHPRIRLRFELDRMSDRTYDFIDRGFDVAFHARELRDSSVRLRKIADLEFVLAAAPEYLRRAGTPHSPAELGEHACLVHGNDLVWRLGSGPDAVQHKVQAPAVSSNSYGALAKLARAGCGIVLLPRRLVERELAGGSLVELFPGMRPPQRTLFAVHAPGRVSERVRIFLDFVVEWFKTADAARDAKR